MLYNHSALICSVCVFSWRREAEVSLRVDMCRFRCVLWVCACERTLFWLLYSPCAFVCVFVRVLCGGRLYNINVLLMGGGVRGRSEGPSPRTRRRLNYLSCSQGVDFIWRGWGGIQDTSHSQDRETEGVRKKKEREDKGGMDLKVYTQRKRGREGWIYSPNVIFTTIRFPDFLG